MGSYLGAMGAESSRESLSKDDLEFLKQRTNFDEQRICDMYKGFLADCPGGEMVPATFCQIYAKCFPAGNVKKFCEHVFRTFDIDKNGVIDFKEFLLSIDVNRYIDMQEMPRLVSSIYKMVAGATTIQLEDTPEERAREIFTKMDVNSDGKVTRKEFTKTCLNDKDLMSLLAPNL